MVKKTARILTPLWKTTLWFWGFALVAALGLAAGGVAVQWGVLHPDTQVQRLLSVQIIPYQGFLMLLAGACAVLTLAFKKSWWVDMVAAGLYFGAIMGLGLLFLVWWEGYQVLADGRLPLTNLFEVTHFLLSLVALYGLWVARRHQTGVFMAFTGGLVVIFALLVLWLEGLDQAGPRHVVPALQSYWLPAHVLANFLAYAAFTVAAGAGSMALLAGHRLAKGWGLPPLDVAERLAARAVAVGFPLFTLAIFLGAIWAYEAWGGYWSWDPKETWALITWLIYASYMHARLQGRVSARGLAWWVVLAWWVMMFCFLGVNLFLTGLHSYGQLA